MKLDVPLITSVFICVLLLFCFIGSLLNMADGQTIVRENTSEHTMTLVDSDDFSFTFNKDTSTFSTDQGEIIWTDNAHNYPIIVADSGFVESNGNGIKIDPLTGNRVGFNINGNIWEGHVIGNVLTIADETEYVVNLSFNDFLLCPCKNGELSALSVNLDNKFVFFSDYNDIYGMSNFGLFTFGAHGKIVYENGDAGLSTIQYSTISNNKLESLQYNTSTTKIVNSLGDNYYLQVIIIPSKIIIHNNTDDSVLYWIISSIAIQIVLLVLLLIQIKQRNCKKVP